MFPFHQHHNINETWTFQKNMEDTRAEILVSNLSHHMMGSDTCSRTLLRP